MLNFYIPDENTMKVIEGDPIWFKDVLRVRNKYGLDKWLFEIERHDNNTKTTYTILPEEKISDDLLVEINSTKLHNLSALPSNYVNDDPLIDSNTIAEFVSYLKMLRSTDVSEFLNMLKVQRVCELRQSDVEAARKILGVLSAHLYLEGKI